MSNELTLIIAVVGLIVSVISIISFIIGRKDRGQQDGKTQGEMHQDIKYIKQTQTDILVSQKEILNKLDETGERVTRLEEKVKSHERRILKLEK